MRINKISILIISLALMAIMSPVSAQDEEKTDGLAQVVLITAKDGQEKALEAAITAFHHYMADKEGAWHYQWYSILTGPNSGSYIARSGNHNWADFDAEHDWDDEADAKFGSDVAPFIADADVNITRSDQDVGIWPDTMEGYQYYSVTNWYIKQGQGRAFDEGLKKIDGILKEAEWPSYYAFVHNVSGGHGNQVTLVSPHKSFADMAPKEPSFIDAMNKAMGEEETRAFLAEFSQTYKTGDRILLRYRADLSDYGQGD